MTSKASEQDETSACAAAPAGTLPAAAATAMVGTAVVAAAAAAAVLAVLMGVLLSVGVAAGCLLLLLPLQLLQMEKLWCTVATVASSRAICPVLLLAWLNQPAKSLNLLGLRDHMNQAVLSCHAGMQQHSLQHALHYLLLLLQLLCSVCCYQCSQHHFIAARCCNFAAVQFHHCFMCRLCYFAFQALKLVNNQSFITPAAAARQLCLLGIRYNESSKLLHIATWYWLIILHDYGQLICNQPL
jgi:hypothetical protein